MSSNRPPLLGIFQARCRPTKNPLRLFKLSIDALRALDGQLQTSACARAKKERYAKVPGRLGSAKRMCRWELDPVLSRRARRRKKQYRRFNRHVHVILIWQFGCAQHRDRRVRAETKHSTRKWRWS
jgi:hypothetical protein